MSVNNTAGIGSHGMGRVSANFEVPKILLVLRDVDFPGGTTPHGCFRGSNRASIMGFYPIGKTLSSHLGSPPSSGASLEGRHGASRWF